MRPFAAHTAVTVGATLLFAGAWPAAAATHSPPPLGGPVLTPDGAAWVTAVGRQAWLWSAPANGRATRRQQLPGAVGFELVDAQMAASSSRLGVMTALARPAGDGRESSSDAERDVLGGPVGGQLVTVSPRCDGPASIPSIDASGGLIAFENCDGDAAVVDPASGAAQTIPGAGRLVRIAGKYMAWLENYQPNGALLWGNRFDIVVFDRLAGAVAYRIPASATDGGVHSFDIQDDGTLALSYVTLNKAGDTSVMRVGWASVASPKLHRVPLGESGTYEVALVNGTIGFERGDGTILEFGEIGSSDFAGHEHLVARNAQGLVGHRSFDFDGQRLTWWSYGCSAARIDVVRKSAATGPRVRSGCALTFRVRPRVVNARALTFRVNCFGFASCTVRNVTLALPGGRRTIVARGHTRRAHFTRAGAALLQARGKLRVTMAATITDVIGRRERRHTHVTIRLP